ncbi:MAG: Phosphoesterase PHP, N-terminal precursor, partial [uncultured Rubrobacteraceae bacterium]
GAGLTEGRGSGPLLPRQPPLPLEQVRRPGGPRGGGGGLPRRRLRFCLPLRPLRGGVRVAGDRHEGPARPGLHDHPWRGVELRPVGGAQRLLGDGRRPAAGLRGAPAGRPCRGHPAGRQSRGFRRHAPPRPQQPLARGRRGASRARRRARGRGLHPQQRDGRPPRQGRGGLHARRPAGGWPQGPRKRRRRCPLRPPPRPLRRVGRGLLRPARPGRPARGAEGRAVLLDARARAAGADPGGRTPPRRGERGVRDLADHGRRPVAERPGTHRGADHRGRVRPLPVCGVLLPRHRRRGGREARLEQPDLAV